MIDLNAKLEGNRGLSTQQALDCLHNDITHELEQFEQIHKRNYLKLLEETFYISSYRSLFRWTSLIFLCVCGSTIFTLYFTSHHRNYLLLMQALVLFGLAALNSFCVYWDNNLKYYEISSLVRKILKLIKEYRNVEWDAKHYPHLHSPLSPCITLQWTLRDNMIVNLPGALLVRGDHILLKPGQKAPGKCQSLNCDNDGCVLHYGDTYAPTCDGIGKGVTSPMARTPLEDEGFLMLETPFLMTLRTVFAEALNRPLTLFNKQAYFLFALGLEFICLPVFVILTLFCNVTRIYYEAWWGGWVEMLIDLPLRVALPLAPTLVPIAWTFLNWAGAASILSVRSQENETQKSVSEDPFGDGELVEDLVLSEQSFDWMTTWKEFCRVATGTQEVPVRSGNLLHVLASITNLCCLDKKGILSWPNPTAEKIFFLHHRSQNQSRSNLFCSSSLDSLEEPLSLDEQEETYPGELVATDDSECVLMSLTHDHLSAFGLQFDDVTWRRYVFSLKPLGLGILLNTCNPNTQDHYTDFCSHITCEAMYNEDLVPVSQRRCLCELPKQMGFQGQALDLFSLEHQLCTFRHVPSGMECKDRLVRSLSISKLKFPFPHMVSVLLRDGCSGKVEMMSQGTADIVLDSCTDYWDGVDVRPFKDKEHLRKKILEFYHRTSLSAYCTAFSYRPTTCDINRNLSNIYMELPIEPNHLYYSMRTPTPHCSTEALFGEGERTECEEIKDVEGCMKVQCKQIFLGMVTMQYQAKTDMVRMIDELEASCIRFVHFSKENELRSRVFSEKMGLESGWNCHISLLSDRTKPESGASSRVGHSCSGLALGQSAEMLNELDLTDSRVNFTSFSRSKSLRKKVDVMSKSNLELFRTISHSAPSAINLDVSQVKFEEDVSICTRSLVSTSDHESDEQEEGERLKECRWHHGDMKCECLNSKKLSPGPQALRTSFSSSYLRSPSAAEFTSSSDQTASLKMFDMSNRARLPKGIENIQPHIESVDNVPLLVSLFTDCTTPTTKEMIRIMQSYTEVVVVIGSTANAENIELFMQADLCIGINPSYPQVCMKEPVFVRPSHGSVLAPSELAQRLNALPCSLSFERDDRISLVPLILKCRNFMQGFMSCFQFWASCSISISFFQFVFAASFLPPILSWGDVMWLVLVQVPLLAISLAFGPANPDVMNQATGKNSVLVNKETVKYMAYYYVPKFLPSILVVIFCSICTLLSFCLEVSGETCQYVYPGNTSYIVGDDVFEEARGDAMLSWGGWGDRYRYSWNIVQKVAVFQIVLYFGIISLSFVHRMSQLWRNNPFSNRLWIFMLSLVIILQIIYSAILIGVEERILLESGASFPGVSEIPLTSIIIGSVWPLVLVPLNELVKSREIRVNVRYQKRAKLEFGTKLGMNSPF